MVRMAAEAMMDVSKAFKRWAREEPMSPVRESGLFFCKSCHNCQMEAKCELPDDVNKLKMIDTVQ